LHTDEALIIRRCQEGDTSSFDLLVKQYYALVYNSAYRIMGNREQAADATQQAFIRAFRSLKSFRGEATFSTWLYRIVTNVCLDQMRQQPHGLVGLTFTDDEGEQQQRPLPAADADPSDTTIQHQRQRLVHEALGQLAPQHRIVLVLYDLNGLSYEEIAAILQVPLGTVKSRLNRARHALKEKLAPHLELFE